MPQSISQDELITLAKKLVRVVEGDTPLGRVQHGEKILIEIQENQDMQLLNALIEAYRERGVQAHYILSHELVSQVLGISKEEAYAKGIVRKGGGGGRGPRDGYVEALEFPLILPEKEKQELADLRKKGVTVLTEEGSEGNSGQMYRAAIRKYITELHPEYDAFYGGRPLRVHMASEVGPKWKGYFSFQGHSSSGIVESGRFASDVWRLIVERTIEVVPWVEEGRIREPQGTDLRFSITRDEAELWSRGTYHVGQVYLYPFQGTRLLYLTEGYKGQVVPKAEGVVAGTSNHNGFYPLLRVHIRAGRVERIEGGGRFGEIWNTILNTDRVRNVHYPFLPDRGYFWVCEGISGTNPKVFRNYGAATLTSELMRAGVFRFGFGVGNLAPEVEEYAHKNGVPNAHGFHVHQYFTTYEVKTRGSERRTKIIDKGHLSALDDPEVRALASRYGEADELLKEDWIPALPGINTKGDFLKDYAGDPLAYERREADWIRERSSQGDSQKAKF